MVTNGYFNMCDMQNVIYLVSIVRFSDSGDNSVDVSENLEL